MSYVYVAVTVLLTVYAQLVVKWRVLEAGALPEGVAEKTEFFLRLMLQPWILSVYLFALLAGVSWMAAMTKLELSYAYPFMSATFVLVTIGSSLIFHEAINLPRLIGLTLIVVGLAIGSQG